MAVVVGGQDLWNLCTKMGFPFCLRFCYAASKCMLIRLVPTRKRRGDEDSDRLIGVEMVE